MSRNPDDRTGLTGAQSEHAPTPGQPPRAGWMTAELVEHTRRVWSKWYGRIIAEQEAVEILQGVRRLSEVVLEAEKKLNKKEEP